MLKRTFQFLGSLKLAVALLTILVVVLSVATFYESKTSTAEVTAKVYRSGWFNVLLGTLAVNLATAALLRWPWRRHQIGFVVTHAGMIILLGGCSAAFHYGTEGMMGLRVGEPPSNVLQMDERALIAMAPELGQTVKERLSFGADGVRPKAMALPGGARLTLDEYYLNADVRLDVREDGAERNPALHLRLTSGEGKQESHHWLAANLPEMSSLSFGVANIVFVAARDAAHLAQLTNSIPADVSGQLTLALTPDGRGVCYAAKGRDGFKSGVAELGKAVEPGWMDLKVTVERIAPNAVLAQEIVPLPQDPDQNMPAIHATVHSGDAKQGLWLRFGEPVTATVAGRTLQMLFAWNTGQLPFTVTLEDFVVERDEGSQNVAGWTSKVRFTDPVSGEEKRASVWMNHPAMFNGYKFSQASWNPQDLKYTVLQVKKDPMWVIVLTWGGSALTIIGICLMFYGRRWVR